jgi:hypothetical protein
VSILIAGGRVVTAEGSFDGDVLIEDGRVASVGRHVPRAADSVLDATGMLVMPGAVDVHTHLDAPNNEITAVPDDEFTCDDYRHGSIAASVGGTTTLIDFATQFPGVGLRATFDEWQAKLAERPLAIDIGLHMIVSDLSVPNAEAELAALCDDGMPSYKLFMAYKESPLMVDDDTLFRVAQVAARRRRRRRSRREWRPDQRAAAPGRRGGQPLGGLARAHPTSGYRGRGRQPGDRALPGRGRAGLHHACVVRRGSRGHRARPTGGIAGAGRDVHALPVRRRVVARAMP